MAYFVMWGRGGGDSEHWKIPEVQGSSVHVARIVAKVHAREWAGFEIGMQQHDEILVAL